MSEVLVDAKFIQNQNKNLSQKQKKKNSKTQQSNEESADDVTVSRVEQKLVQLSNGCICCTLREDLLQEVTKLAQENKFDYLLIESTGISEPLPVAETFTFDIEEQVEKTESKNSNSAKEVMKKVQTQLKDVARLDTMVTVVDCYNWLMDFTSEDALQDREMAAGEDDERTVTDLLLDQVEFSNIIVLNKTDLIDEKELGILEGVVHHLNPDAKIIKTNYSKVPLEYIFNTHLFDFEKASQNPGWLKELRGEHVPETLEYGVTSFVYSRRRPFNPSRLVKFISNEEDLAPVIRSKGFFWLCTKMDTYGIWSQAGRTLRIEAGGKFFAAIPEKDWVLDANNRFSKDSNQSLEEFIAQVKEEWDPKWGDRRQELVFMGVGMDHEKMTKLLDACLLTDEEMALGPKKWAEFEDPIEMDNLDDSIDDEECDEEGHEHHHHHHKHKKEQAKDEKNTIFLNAKKQKKLQSNEEDIDHSQKIEERIQRSIAKAREIKRKREERHATEREAKKQKK